MCQTPDTSLIRSIGITREWNEKIVCNDYVPMNRELRSITELSFSLFETEWEREGGETETVIEKRNRKC